MDILVIKDQNTWNRQVEGTTTKTPLQPVTILYELLYMKSCCLILILITYNGSYFKNHCASYEFKVILIYGDSYRP